MTLVQGSIPNFINGVSRQPNSARLSSQLEEQINCFSSPQRGMVPRGPLFHTKNLAFNTIHNVFVHPIKRDTTERYFVVITNGDLKVFDLSGDEKTVAFPNGKTYLVGTVPHDNFRAATNADHTFIVNRNKQISMDATSATALRNPEALVFVRAVNHGKDYKVRVNGSVVASFTTPGNQDASGVDLKEKQRTTTPTNVASLLHDNTGINQELSTVVYMTSTLPGTDWTLKRYGNVIHIINKLGNDFTISVESDEGSERHIIATKGKIEDFSDLPNYGPIGFNVRVTGQPADNRDDYWVRIEKDGAGSGDDENGEIYWVECPAPGTIVGFDATTMPHVLVREADGTFTFKQATWVDRKVGDNEVSPTPSFVTASGIQALFFHHGRLGLLVRDSVVMTRPGEFFDFWRSTMTTVLDDDPIDISIADGPVALFKRALVWEGDLYLFSDETIHRMNVGQILTPKSVSVDLIKHEAIDPSLDPVVTPRSLIYVPRAFWSQAGKSEPYGELKEMAMSPDTEREVSGSIADHVPGYLQSSMKDMVSSPENNMIAIVPGTGADRTGLYIYQYYWVGNEKVQSSWHKWTLDPSMYVMGCEFFENELHIIWRETSTNDYYLMYIPIQAFLRDPGQQWMIRLDRRVSSSHADVTVGTFDGTRTLFTLPYATKATTRAIYGPSEVNHGMVLEIESTLGNAIYLVGDHTATDVVFGNIYEQRATLSKLFMKEGRGDRGGQVALVADRLQLHRMIFNAYATGYYRVEVKPYSTAPARTATPYGSFSADDIDASALDETHLDEEPMSVGISAKASRALIEIVNDSHYPFAIQGAEWYGTYAPKARRV